MAEIEDFKRRKAVKHFREIIGRIKLCMFCTRLGHVPFASRPMVTMKVDDECRLWFFSNAGSHKNAQIIHDDRVELLYEDAGNSEFLDIHGTAEIMADTQKCIELWNSSAQDWFPDGPEDPDLTIIIVTPMFFHYWQAKQYKLVAMQNKAKAAGAQDYDEKSVAVAA